MRPLSLLAALSALLLNSCYSAGDGKPPPLESLYFPTGLALDGVSLSDEGNGAPKYLYVASSDFDLQYRSAALVSYDLDVLRQLLPKNCNSSADCHDGQICDALGVTNDPSYVPSYFCVDPPPLDPPTPPDPCGSIPVEGRPLKPRDEADRLLYPGLCESLNQLSVLVDKVGIGAFATDVIWRKNPNADPKYPSRLFLPVRGDATLHWVDLKDGRFTCGQDSSDDDSCDGQHRSGDSESDNLDQLRQAPEPFALDATADGAYVAITNQTSGSVSLYNNDWSQQGPKLVSVLGNLPQAPVAIAALPEVVFADGHRPEPGFLVAYRNAPRVDLLRVHAAEPVIGQSGVPYTRFALTEAASAPINANSIGFDSRGIVIDDAQRRQDYAVCQAVAGDCAAAADPSRCQADLTTCLLAVHQPDVFVANRAPSSLLVGAMTRDVGYSAGTSELPSFTDSVALTSGPSRVELGEVKVPGTAQSKQSDDHGPYELERRVFIVCFDSRRIFVYDPKRRVIDSIVRTGRGPYALAVDGIRGLAYVAHFTDSYLGVISLDQRFPQTYATIVASIGVPTPPRTSK